MERAQRRTKVTTREPHRKKSRCDDGAVFETVIGDRVAACPMKNSTRLRHCLSCGLWRGAWRFAIYNRGVLPEREIVSKERVHGWV